MSIPRTLLFGPAFMLIGGTQEVSACAKIEIFVLFLGLSQSDILNT
jgi:hypothetical protein